MRKKIITLSEDQYKLIKERADRNKRSMNAEIDMAIDSWVDIRPAVFSGNLENAKVESGIGEMGYQPEGKVYPGYNGMNEEVKKFLDGHRAKVTGEGVEESEVSKAIKEFGIDKVLENNKPDEETEFNELNSAARNSLENDLKFCSSRADVEKVARKYKLI